MNEQTRSTCPCTLHWCWSGTKVPAYFWGGYPGFKSRIKKYQVNYT